MPSHRILYVGADCDLPARLHDALKPLDCLVVRCPAGSMSRLFIESRLEYSLLLFDDGPAGAELARFARSLEHRERTPFVIVKKSEDCDALAGAIRRLLDI